MTTLSQSAGGESPDGTERSCSKRHFLSMISERLILCSNENTMAELKRRGSKVTLSGYFLEQFLRLFKSSDNYSLKWKQKFSATSPVYSKHKW